MTLIKDTLERLKQATFNPSVRKDTTTQGFVVASGLQAYNLEPVAKLVYPVLTPLRNEIPRTTKQAGAGKAVNWKAILGINTAGVRAGVIEGQRGTVISTQEKDYLATYKGLGMENSVTFEADYGGKGFDDLKNLATLTLMQSVMIQEEAVILHGNASLALGRPVAPVAVGSVAGGSITTGASYAVYVVALTYDAYQYISTTLTSASVLVPVVTQISANAETTTFGGGVSQISPVSNTVATTSGNNSITATVTAIKGAVAYAWFLSTDGTLANATLNQVTTVNAVKMTALSVSTYAGNSAGLNADNSVNATIYDGLITQALNGNGYFKSLDNVTLTADGEAGVVQIDDALKYFWDTYRITPSVIRVGSQVLKDISAKVLSSSNNPVFRIDLSSGKAQGTATAGTLVTSYLNKYGLNGAMELPIKLHPNMPPGMIFLDMDQIPYPNSNIPGARQIECRQDYYQLEWPLITRKWQYGVYLDCVLKCYTPFTMGVICNIAPG